MLLILSLICVELPMALAEMPAADDLAAVDVPAESEEEDEAEEDESDSRSYRLLQRGDVDGDDSTDIVTLQNRLIELGYLHDAADGIYGLNSQKAVASFQRNNGLTETGMADADTQDKLYNGDDLVYFSEADDPESVAYRVQEKLNQWGFAGEVPNGLVNQKTGDSIPEFKSYLTGYLRAHPTPAPEATATPEPTESTGFGDAAIAVDTPIVKDSSDEITQDILDFVNGKYEFEVYTETLSNGDSGTEVLRLQRRLYDLNYLAVADGSFGENTERALLYFQKKNGLTPTAVADEATQRLLYSEAAVEAEEYVNAYKYIIDVSDQRVYVYQWNGSNYNNLVGEMICSTGKKDTPTPLGTYQAAGPTGTGEWYYFNTYTCYAKWATRIVGGILFHSVVYSKGKVLNKTSVRKLGKRASHGCIRLKVEHAQWIYENCPPGTTVVVQE